MTEFRQYRRKAKTSELRRYVPGELLHRVSISASDREAGSPKVGDMIARNPDDHDDQWLVAAKYFEDNFEPRHGIYTASKTKHANKWRTYRAGGYPVISTWIDEAGEGESSCLTDLWRRCIDEAANAAALVLYAEPGEILKGAWTELGAALARGVPVFAVGIGQFTVANHAGITHCSTVDEAMLRARALLEGCSE